MRNFFGTLILFSLAAMVLIVGCKDSATEPEVEGLNILVVSNFEEGNAWIDTNFTKQMEKIKITTIDVSTDTLVAEDLEGFNVILLYEDGIFGNSASVGNMIYKYVMAGGDLVIGTFYWQDHSGEQWNGSWGDLEMIEPLYSGSCRYTVDSLGSTIDHPLTAGVNSLKTFYRGGPNTLRENATAVAWWSNEDILIAFNKPKGTITMVTTYPAENYYFETRGNPDAVEGDFFKLWENALRWTAQNNNAVMSVAPDIERLEKKIPQVQDKVHEKSGGGRNF
jgi:hypothetical protein